MTDTPCQDDLRWMRRALDLAVRARGRTSPNPLVGAVVVCGGEVVGEGFHGRAGEPHAEVIALAAAGERAKGSTLYVTLEPCTHEGRTAPCAPAVAQAGVARVVSALEDPDPRVHGNGHRALRASGVDVSVGVLEDEARRLNEEFLHRIATGRAFGVLKAAVTLDGRLAADGSDARWITGAEARERAHELRDRYDAVLVGRGTLSQDDPALDVQLPGDRRDPVAVVVDSRLSAPSDRKLWQRSKEGAKVLVVATDGAPEEHVRRLGDFGVEVVRAAAAADGRVDLVDLFRRLGERGLNSVMVEGGEAVHTSALRAGLVGRVHLFVAPTILGGSRGPRLVGDLGLRNVAEGLRLTDPVWETLGRDALVTGRLAKAVDATPAPGANGNRGGV
jgi:diaminohydroxyphosphoribosylaminopyrimidine deaminase/5-amino-6-(5-phosphoribosylamino)uracil reductase